MVNSPACSFPRGVSASREPLPPTPSPQRRGGEEETPLGLLPLSVAGRGSRTDSARHAFQHLRRGRSPAVAGVRLVASAAIARLVAALDEAAPRRDVAQRPIG